MKITPLEVRQRSFESSFRGFERSEVESFLQMVSAEFEELVKESNRLREELRRCQLQLEGYRDRERTLQDTMITAQRMTEELKVGARKEADIILAEAEHEAEKIVQSAHQKLVQVVEDINELKRQRVQFESQLRGVIDGHLKLLETFRQSTFADSDWERINDNVSFLAPKKMSGA
jgi:cell division initiation protein